MFYRDAHVAVVVFDMAELSSLLSVNNWKTGVHRYISNETPVLLVGNKVCICICVMPVYIGTYSVDIS